MFDRRRIDPIKYMRARGWPVDHITYDPKMRKGEYSVICQSTHDGTLLFTYELIDHALGVLAGKISYYKPREADFASCQDVRYVVGPLRLATVYGRVKLPCSEDMKYPGQKERVRIPVRMITSPRQA